MNGIVRGFWSRRGWIFILVAALLISSQAWACDLSNPADFEECMHELDDPAIPNLPPQPAHPPPTAPRAAKSINKDANFVGRLIAWNVQRHDYPTYGGNHYSTYDAYALIRKPNGQYLLFADLGDTTLPYIISTNKTGICADIESNESGKYQLWRAVCNSYAEHAVPAGSSLGSWEKFDYSWALCETMNLNQCP